MITRKALSVARWEFVERVKTKSFILGLFLTPAIMALFILAPAALESVVSKDEATRIMVYDGSGMVYDSLVAYFNRNVHQNSEPDEFHFSRLRASDMESAKQALDAGIVDESIDAAILIPDDITSLFVFEYRGRNVSNVKDISILERAMTTVLLEHTFKQAGVDAALLNELNRSASVKTVRVSESGEKETGFFESFGIAYVFIIMLFIMILSSGQLLVRSMVEEKNNRIVEILVSSCSSNDLMFGKIIGLSLLGIVQIGVLSLVGLAIASGFGLESLPLENLWLMIAYLLLGFLFYAAVFVAMGSIASTEQEAAQITGYLSIFLMLPLVVAIIAIQSPDNPVLVALTMIPFLTPSIMMLRLAVLTPPTWQILLSMGIMVGSFAGMIWVAARIFRIGILLTGKRPSLGQVVRWLRG